MADNPSISIVIPVFNEEESLQQLYSELVQVLAIFDRWEIIFVDDGSSDSSYQVLKKTIHEDNRIVAIRFFKNFGKADALSEGFRFATGQIIITLDGDLQDNPSEIPKLINLIEEGWDVVSGWKKDRKDPASKRIPSKLFNFVTRMLT